ncbi:MAG: EcsC family protein [Veillonellales bacterium]
MKKYDRNALIEIEQWKNPPRTFLTKVADTINKPLSKVGEIILDNKVGEVISNSIQGIISLLNDASSWSVRTDAIFREFEDNGYSVKTISDIEKLQLEEVDRVVGFLGAKYKTTAFAEGAATGAAGGPGIAADIPLLFGIALRAIGEYATYYGFDINRQEERQYILDILMLVSSPTQAAKQQTMVELTKIASAVAKKKTWKEIEKIGLATTLKKIGEQLGFRMTKAKLGQIVPIFGAVVGAGYNTYFIKCVCDASYFLYRERFLARTYDFEIESKLG